MNTGEALLEVAQGLRADLDRVIASLGEGRMVEPGSFGEWSFKDLVVHLTS